MISECWYKSAPRTGRAIPGLRRDAALPVRQNTRQGREGGVLPKPFFNIREDR